MKIDIFIIWYVLLMSILVYINGLMNYLGDKYYVKKLEIPIFDVVHNNLPQIPQKYHIIFDVASIGAAFFVMFNGFFYEYLNEFFILMILRGITGIVTILPHDPVLNCNPQNNISFTSHIDGCYDKIFSGHTATIFLAYLFIRENNMLPVGLIEVMVILTLQGLIMSRYHYTVDVVLALIITYLLHHYLGKNNSLI